MSTKHTLVATLALIALISLMSLHDRALVTVEDELEAWLEEVLNG